ncbi:hypothetical protein Tco_1266836 [Tanacetum coccineum]
MASVSTVPQLVNKKGGSYVVIAPKLEPGKFNKWKKRMLCYLARMEPYYIQCIKDGPFKPKMTEGAIKPEAQWTQDERRVVVQDQCLKSIIIFEGPSNTKENRIMDLKLEYQTFRAKPSKSLSQTYTLDKTFLNELANDGVNLSKHEINVGFVNSLSEKWLTFNQGLRNANPTQTLDLVDIYGRFVYEDNLIQRRYSDTKKALITTPSTTVISTAFFSNNVLQNFQENSNDEKYYKAEYKKMKAQLALLEASLLMRYSAFGRHLEEIHVTWAHLENKRTRLRTYTNISQEFLLRGWRRRHRLHVTPS